jgi:hypothetical protein
MYLSPSFAPSYHNFGQELSSTSAYKAPHCYMLPLANSKLNVKASCTSFIKHVIHQACHSSRISFIKHIIHQARHSLSTSFIEHIDYFVSSCLCVACVSDASQITYCSSVIDSIWTLPTLHPISVCSTLEWPQAGSSSRGWHVTKCTFPQGWAQKPLSMMRYV